MSTELEPFPLAGICAAYLPEIEEELQSSFVKVTVRLIGKNEIAPKALSRLAERIGGCLGAPKLKAIVEVSKENPSPDSVSITAILLLKNNEKRRSSASISSLMQGGGGGVDPSKVRENLKTTVQRQNAAKKLGEEAELVPFAGFTLIEISAEEDLTTREVCDVYVKPKTMKDKVSFVEMLGEEQGVVSSAGTIVIHAWTAPFKSIWQSLEPEIKAREDDAASTFIWLDLFSVSQHTVYNTTARWLTTTLCEAIGTIGSSVLVLADWKNPVPFRRLWCIWEILATIQQGTELSVIMPPEKRKTFDERVFHDLPAVIKASFDAIDSEHASATLKNDEIQITSSIRDSIGFDGANLVTKDRLLEWLADVSEVTARDPDRTRDHLATATFCYRLAKIMSSGQGKHAEAEAMLRKAFDIRTVELGPMDDLTTECAIALANVFRIQGKVSEAEVTLRRVCENLTLSKGAKHEDTLLALATLTRVLVDRGSFEEAEKICEETLSVTETKFGLNDKRTLEALVTLSQLADLRCDSDMAAQRLRKALEGSEKLLGPDAPQTLSIKADLAGFLAELENFDEAEALFKEASEKLTEKLGGAHEWTIKATTGLTVLQKVKEGLGPGYTPGKYASKAAVPNIPSTIAESQTSNVSSETSMSPKKPSTSATGVQKKISFDPKVSEGGKSEVVEEVAEQLTSLRETRHEKIKSQSSKTTEPTSRRLLRGYLEKLPIELSQRERERLVKKGGSGLIDDGSGLIKPESKPAAKPRSMLLSKLSSMGSFKSKPTQTDNSKRKSFTTLNTTDLANLDPDALKLKRVNANFEKRFFQVQANKKASHLVYWLTEDDLRNGRDKRGDFPLDDVNTRIFETSPFGPLSFSVTGPKGRLHLKAENEKSKEEWIEVIKTALAFRGAADKAKLLENHAEIPAAVEEKRAFFTGSFVNMDSLLGEHSAVLNVGEALLKKSLQEMEDDD